MDWGTFCSPVCGEGGNWEGKWVRLSSISNQIHGLMIVIISISQNILREAEASCRCSREFRASFSLERWDESAGSTTLDGAGYVMAVQPCSGNYWEMVPKWTEAILHPQLDGTVKNTRTWVTAQFYFWHAGKAERFKQRNVYCFISQDLLLKWCWLKICCL